MALVQVFEGLSLETAPARLPLSPSSERLRRRGPPRAREHLQESLQLVELCGRKPLYICTKKSGEASLYIARQNHHSAYPPFSIREQLRLQRLRLSGYGNAEAAQKTAARARETCEWPMPQEKRVTYACDMEEVLEHEELPEFQEFLGCEGRAAGTGEEEDAVGSQPLLGE